MYVRLAFAVAAHLEPEILIVDEVLAVGDIEFQRKCLGRMRELSGSEGRTVLFVSHNMNAIESLCDSLSSLVKRTDRSVGLSRRYCENLLSHGRRRQTQTPISWGDID